jgi:quercetin dioxygenase-like cupin family protein
MHVAPIDLRTVRQDGMLVRFGLLGSMAYALAEVPPGGSAGTSLDRPCTDPHWGFVIEGELTFVTDRRREIIPAGRAFHVPARGAAHRFETDGAALLAGFAPVEPELDVSDSGLEAQGFEIVVERSPSVVVPDVAERRVAPGRIDTESWPMSKYLLTRVRMGERSGYAAGWCDAPHWGIVTSGRLAIEYEDDVEILAPGDVFHTPPGPPGHRIEAADPASFIDLTPIAAYKAGGRLVDWRRGLDPAEAVATHGIAVAALF